MYKPMIRTRGEPSGGTWAALAMALCAASLIAASGAQGAGDRRSVLVADRAQYAAAVESLKPGDTIVLADGEWRDFQIVFAGRGTERQPITLTAQTPGQAILTGRSNLRMAGEHLHVSNLVFRDGWSPTGEVVSFRRSREQRADHSRVSGVVIDGYSNPDRSQSDHWVAMYGHHNRFDHGHLTGKSNAGATLVVVRDEEQGLDNRHRIDHNWFGPRPNLGSNGGETIRVGTSHDSLSDSHTVVEDNWFERCDGEVEIVSNKSGANVYRRNVFFESRGALVLRHGDGNLVESNVFLGGGKPHTGGIRVINRRQTVRNNYLEGLAGEGFASALSVMYGVPDSPLNRYVQVDGAAIENNTFVGVRSILLGAGKDAERSLAPANSRIARNLIVGTDDPIKVLGDMSGIAFEGNLQSPAATPATDGGFASRRLATTRAPTGLLVVDPPGGAGAGRDLRPIPRERVGVPWYPKDPRQPALDSGALRQVRPGEDTLTAAVAAAQGGDRLRLAPGRYAVSQVLTLDRPLTVMGPAQGAAEISFSRPVLFEIGPGGALKLDRVTVSGTHAPDQAGNAVIRTRPGSGAANYALVLERARFSDMTVNRGFDVVSMGKDTMAGSITLRSVEVDGLSGSVIDAAAETDDRGTYNAESIVIEDSRFSRVGAAAVDLYRGGTDESTFGPKIAIRGSRFDRVGRQGGTSLRLHGVQRAELDGNRFEDSGAVRFVRTVGEPVLLASDNRFVGTPGIQSDVPAGAIR